MALNVIWPVLFLLAIVAALLAGGQGQGEVLNQTVQAMLDGSKQGFELALGLGGMLTLWLGLMQVGEASGLIQALARALSPLLRPLFPEVPAGHPAMGSMAMNMVANMLGLDNAATPLGLKAMQDLQSLNPNPERASNAQVLFLVINTASVTLLPVTVIAYRAQLGAAMPADVTLPLVLTGLVATVAGVGLTVLWNRQRLSWRWLAVGLAALLVLGSAMVWAWWQGWAQLAIKQSGPWGSALLLLGVAMFLGWALWKRVPVFETFIVGAKQGFDTAVRILPFLVAMLALVAVLRSSGVMNGLMHGARVLLQHMGLSLDLAEVLPTAIMKSFSGSGARGLMLETMRTHGADSMVGRMVSVIQGSSETTLYVLAVYFGSVGIRQTRHALWCGLFADLVAVSTGMVLCWFWFR